MAPAHAQLKQGAPAPNRNPLSLPSCRQPLGHDCSAQSGSVTHLLMYPPSIKTEAAPCSHIQNG